MSTQSSPPPLITPPQSPLGEATQIAILVSALVWAVKQVLPRVTDLFLEGRRSEINSDQAILAALLESERSSRTNMQIALEQSLKSNERLVEMVKLHVGALNTFQAEILSSTQLQLKLLRLLAGQLEELMRAIGVSEQAIADFKRQATDLSDQAKNPPESKSPGGTRS